jgi:hypothetical protein
MKRIKGHPRTFRSKRKHGGGSVSTTTTSRSSVSTD